MDNVSFSYMEGEAPTSRRTGMLSLFNRKERKGLRKGRKGVVAHALRSLRKPLRSLRFSKVLHARLIRLKHRGC